MAGLDIHNKTNSPIIYPFCKLYVKKRIFRISNKTLFKIKPTNSVTRYYSKARC